MLRTKLAAFLFGILLFAAIGAALAEDLSAFYSAQVGDVVSFGMYEQDNDESNGYEPIEWMVLENTGESILLYSVHALECMQYNSSEDPSTWETCSLRAWLNGEFYAGCFSDAEKALIKLNHLENPSNEQYDVPGGNPTEDYVFILSAQEIRAYFASEEDMAATATPYAVAHGAETYGEDKTVRYWLRNPGMTDKSAAFVQYDFLNYAGTAYAKVREYAVRPAIRLDISAAD